MDKQPDCRADGLIFVDKRVESVDEATVYEPYIHLCPSVYAFVKEALLRDFTIHDKPCLFGNISSVILKKEVYPPY